MAAPLVSIIMPSHNHREFIAMAIESVLAQTHVNVELIVCDDASTDGTGEVAQGFAARDERVTVLRNPVNLGISKTRQRLLDRARGAYVGHLDSDDLLERWAVEEMLQVFMADPALALVYSDMAFMDIEGRVTSYQAAMDYSYRNLAYLGWRHFGMYRRDIALQCGGYNPALNRGCEDGDLFMNIASRFPCRRLPKVLYYYRSHHSNSSRDNQKCANCDVQGACNYYAVWSRVVKEHFPEHAPDPVQA